MSRVFIVNPPAGTASEADFPTLVSVVKGTSIVSLADSDQFIEFGLSENLMMRIESSEGGALNVSLSSTLNADEVRPVRLQLVNDDEEPGAALVERRLHSLRQVYAITLLLDAGRQEELAAALLSRPGIMVDCGPDEDQGCSANGAQWAFAHLRRRTTSAARPAASGNPDKNPRGGTRARPADHRVGQGTRQGQKLRGQSRHSTTPSFRDEFC